MQLNLFKRGPGAFTTDQYHVRQNYEDDVPQVWVGNRPQRLNSNPSDDEEPGETTGTKLVFGHDEGVV